MGENEIAKPGTCVAQLALGAAEPRDKPLSPGRATFTLVLRLTAWLPR